MKPLNFRHFLFMLLTAFTCLSVTAQSSATDKPEFPTELGNASAVLLVIDADNFQVRKCLNQSLEKYYKGAYEVIQESQLSNAKYKDLDKFPYVMRIYTKFNPGQTIGRDRFPPTTDYSYGVRDRKNAQVYKLDYLAGAYKKSMVKYIKKLEAIRSGDED